MVVLLSPGQGSQTPGLLASWLTLPGATERVARWSEVARLDLAGAGTSWSADAVRDTAVAQPLLTVAALLSARALLGDSSPAAVCGHSVGELPALALAGVIDDDEAVALAALRGRAMAAAAAGSPTCLVAVLGGEPDEVARVAAGLGLEVATINVSGQIVFGGPAAAVAALQATPPTGARVRPLDVAGAFHTSAMAPATGPFRAALADLRARPARCTIVANRDGASVTDGAEALERLAGQLTAAVRFDLCLSTVAQLAPGGVVELAPGGTLTAMVKRALPGVETVALRTADDLPAARALLPSSGEQLPVAWRALPSPESGVVDQLRLTGAAVAAGEAVAVVVGRSGAATVLAPVAGTVTEWLVSPGDPVRPGQLLAVLG